MIVELVSFLSTNPWVVITGGLITLVSTLQWYFSNNRRAAFWLSKRAKYDAKDVHVAAENPSYYLSVILENLGILGFFGVLSALLFHFSSGFIIDFENVATTIGGILVSLLAMLLFGAAYTVILYTSFFAQEVQKALQNSGSKKKKSKKN